MSADTEPVYTDVQCRSYFLEQNCLLNVIMGIGFIIIIFLAIVVLKSPTSEKIFIYFFKICFIKFVFKFIKF